ncbi:MAG: hypothetical protein HQM09_15460 [Candidatus Riflebacteria bacterium]|nr:hypothetical protein [Candidatus Riflebacteria bacterium]
MESGRLRFFLVFAAIGVFLSEACSFNIPYALALPTTYPVYGLIFLFTIDALVRSGERRFFAWYIGGLFVGLITETYVAKVVFYGLSPDEPRVWGLAPLQILFVVMGFHPFFSFMLPAYIARRLLGFPLPISISRFRDLLALAAAPIYTLTAFGVASRRPWSPAAGFLLFAVSAAILVVWVIWLRRRGYIKDIRLTSEERRWVWWRVTIPIYLFFFFAATNDDHGGKHLPPFLPCVAVTIVIALLLVAWWYVVTGRVPGIFRREGEATGYISKGNELFPPEEVASDEVGFDPVSVSFWPFLAYIAWILAIHAFGMLFWYSSGRPLFPAAVFCLALMLIGMGLISTPLSLYHLAKCLLEKHRNQSYLILRR